MKKTFIALALLCSLSACSPKIYTLGMSEDDFLKHNHNAELVRAQSGETVYRISKQVATWHPGTKFYYFSNGELVKIDLGVRNPDVVIQNNNQ